ncbi:MAG: hypothetical protein ACLFVR_11250 [Thiohalospira sp.]
MRNILLNIALLALIFAVGCSEDEDLYPYTGAAGVQITSDGLTALDNEVAFNITATNESCTELDVNLGGSPLGTVSLTEGAGTYTATAEALGISAIEDAATLTFIANTDKEPVYNYTVEVEDPITIVAPDNLYQNDTEVYVKFNIEPVAASVTDVTIQTKVNSNDPTDVTGTYNANDSILVVGSDYAIGDTVYFMVTGEAGTKSTTSEVSMIVERYSYANKETFMLDMTSDMAYDLILMREVDVTEAGDSADIEIDYAEFTGGYSLGFIANQNAEFVVATEDDYKDADINLIEATDFSGAITNDDDVAVDDVFIFRTNRSGGDYSYGIFKIIDVVKPQGVIEDSYIEIEVKY